MKIIKTFVSLIIISQITACSSATGIFSSDAIPKWLEYAKEGQEHLVDNEYKKHILDPEKNPLLNKFRKERYMVEVNSSLQIQKNRFTSNNPSCR